MKRRSRSFTAFPGTLRVRLIAGFPSILTHHIVHFLPFHLLLLIVAAVDEEFIRTRAAFEAVLTVRIGDRGSRPGDCEGIGATRADYEALDCVAGLEQGIEMLTEHHLDGCDLVDG